MAVTNKALEALLGLSGTAHNLTRAEMLAARTARVEAAAQAAAKVSGRSSGGMFNPLARTVHTGGAIPPTSSTGRNIVRGMRGTPAVPRKKGWIRRHPALAMSGGAMGLAGGSLLRNTGAGATGNGYTGIGNSSGGRGY
jgi:hypothetical protein